MRMDLESYKKGLSKYTEFIIWGSGTAGKEILSFLQDCQPRAKVYFADSNSGFWGKERHGRMVLAPDEVKKIMKDHPYSMILIGSKANVEIMSQISRLGIDGKRVDVNALGIVRNFYERDALAVITQNGAEIEKAYQMLADEKSKDVYEKVMRYRCTGDMSFLDGISDKEVYQYFEPGLIHLDDHEIFVDCGAYDGDTLQRFQELTDAKFSGYYLFEPDESVYKRLRQAVMKIGKSNIYISSTGCWSEKAELHFQKSGTWSSRIDPAGDSVIPVDSLDHLLSAQVPTFIKMDIEGAELEALKGASEIIRRYHPKLAVSIYHKLEDIFRIPLFIHGLSAHYRLYIRVYADRSDTEIVCYAI
mgnify:CR=1 FL=1